ncbi:MAG: ISAzo13 family transposase, partial [Frankiaceae bacterium]
SRRLVAGFLARLYGHGGITLLARVTGLDRNTIALGRRELDRADALSPGRVRRPGGGPKRVEARSPES